jgi:putative membrane protein
MSPAVQSVLSDWTLPVPLTTLTLLTCIVYVRGWFALRRTRPRQFDSTRLACFLAGMGSLWLAIGSPMDAFADVLLSAHMVEHIILMSVVPPLVLLGQPVVPLLRGLPKFIQKRVVGPLVRLRWLRRFFHWLVRPVVAWFAMNLALLSWHVPAAYDYALENETVHDIEHLCFLIGSLLFWWCLIRPWPATPRRHDWSILLFLVTADGVNTALSAFLAFCNRPVYTYYVTHPNPFHIAPMPDQVLGAVIMWVVGSVAFLFPAFGITLQLLQPARERRTSLHRV